MRSAWLPGVAFRALCPGRPSGQRCLPAWLRPADWVCVRSARSIGGDKDQGARRAHEREVAELQLADPTPRLIDDR